MLSDALPAHIHITVPRSASRRRPGYRLHTNRITPAEITHYGGLQVTTVARTIGDIAFDGLADDLAIQAVQEAVARGLASPQQLLAAAAQRGPAVAHLIQRALERSPRAMTYQTAAAFRRVLETRLVAGSARTGTPLVRLRKLVTFDRFLARLTQAQPHAWLLKGGLALQLRMSEHARTTQDVDVLHDPAAHRGAQQGHAGGRP